MGRYLGLVIDAVGLLAAFVLAFGAITLIWRRHWEGFGPVESLLARLAAAGVLAVLGLSGVAPFAYLAFLIMLSSEPGGSAAPGTPLEGRNQALAVSLGALALAIILVLRIELYHRRVTGISRRQSEDEWVSEEHEEPRAPRRRI